MDDFLDAIRRVAAGGSALDPEIVAALLASAGRSDPLAVLTPREHEVLSLVAEGQSNAAVTRRLYLAERTVETHMRSIFQNCASPTPATRTAGCWRARLPRDTARPQA